MDSLDGFQPERDGRAAEVDRQAEEEQKAGVYILRYFDIIISIKNCHF